MEFFAILEIAQTKDEELIKRAYREKLSTVNPEDDPEGFKRLRSAYEQALEWAKRPDEEERDKGPVDLLIDKFEVLYNRMADRIEPQGWKELLQDPLFDSLDLEENAKWSLFDWLAEHWRLPLSIWRLLDQTFFIVENGGEFREHLPEGFVDFMEQKLADNARNSEFPYERFRGKEDGTDDYDAFLIGYEELCRFVEDWNPEAAKLKIDYLESTGINHPWFLLEKARFLVRAERKEEAVSLVRELLASDGDEIQIYLGCARLFKEMGLADECLPMFEKMYEEKFGLDNVRYHVSAALAEIYEQQGRLPEARKKCLDALDVYEADEVVDMLARINGVLIDKWTAEPEALTPEETYQLAWCYLQTERGEEGLAFLAKHHFLELDTLKCHRTKAIMALQTDHPQDALEYCADWRRKLDEMKAAGEECEPGQSGERSDDPAKDTRMDAEGMKDSWVQCCRVEGDTFRQMAEQTEDEKEKAGFIEKAQAAYTHALEMRPDDITLTMSMLMLVRDKKDYQEMVKLCEKLKELDRGYYWAYFYAQEANWNLRNGQEVIDNFYGAKQIYPGHAVIYERAAEVFQDYRQYRDVEKILGQADEAGVDSPKLKLLRLTLMEVQAEDEEALRAADAYAEKAMAEMEEENAEPEVLAAAYLERVYIHTDSNARSFRSKDNIIEWASRSVKLNDTVDARYSLGRAICLFRDEPGNAMEHLKICEERGMTFCWMYYYMAECYEDLEEWDNAIAYYKKAMEADPEETDFAWRVAWLYRRKFARTGQKVYADKAFEYLEKQQEVAEKNSTDYWQYSDLYSTLGKFDLALEEIEHALETEKRARNWGQKAQLLELLHRREEAVPFYEKGLEAEIEKGRDYSFSYSQMADYFCETHRYAEGIAWFEAWMPRVQTEEQKETNLNYIKKIYIRMGQYDKALEIVQRRYGSTDLTVYGSDSWEKEGVRIADLLDIYQYYMTGEELLGKVREAINLLEGEGAAKLAEDKHGRFRGYRDVAYSYALYLMDDRMGLHYFQKTLQILRDMGEDADSSDYNEVYEELMGCCYRLGEKELARDYRKLFEEHIAKKYEECRELEMPPLKMHECVCGRPRPNLYQLFLCAYYTEEYEKAREYVKKMEDSAWCCHCTHSVCDDLLECHGYLALIDGDLEKARECFTKADQAGPYGSFTARYELRRLDDLEK